MVVVRSARRDRWLLIPVWALTFVVLALGIALVVPILIFWGAVGLLGAVFATRVLLRDIRSETTPAAAVPPAADDEPTDDEPNDDEPTADADARGGRPATRSSSDDPDGDRRGNPRLR